MKKKLQQILAWIGIFILVGMYLITLLAALFDPSQAKGFLKASITLTVILPVFLYACILVYRFLSNKH